MFRTPKPNVIESDTGFSVEQTTTFMITYREGEKKVTCDLEYYGRGPALFLVYLAQFDSWDPPLDTVPISDEEWGRIGDNIREAYRSQGIEIDFRLLSLMEKEYGKRLRRALRSPDHPKSNDGNAPVS